MTLTTEHRADSIWLFYVTSVSFTLFAFVLSLMDDPYINFFWFTSAGSFLMGTLNLVYYFANPEKVMPPRS